MTDNEMQRYMGELIQKYDYYDPIKDRTEALRVGSILKKDILDVGSGNGYIAILAAKNFHCDVTSIDISEDKINIARINAEKEGVLDKIEFKLDDATSMSFKQNHFDVAISFNALHHCKGNYKKIIKEMFRVARDKVIITELNQNGAKLFDEYIHPEEHHKDMAIDLKELENNLKKYSSIKRFDRKLMSTFVCVKNQKGDR